MIEDEFTAMVPEFPQIRVIRNHVLVQDGISPGNIDVEIDVRPIPARISLEGKVLEGTRDEFYEGRILPYPQSTRRTQRPTGIDLFTG